MKQTVRIGTRGSKLALYQAYRVKEELEAKYPEIVFEIEKTMRDAGNQSRFEEACQIAKIDLIDLENHLPLLNVIKYAKLPGYVEDRFLMKSLARTALETQIKINENQMNKQWCDYRRRIAYEVENKTISDYILKLKL